jgi:DNA replication initiation complex subunit (GINS family)
VVVLPEEIITFDLIRKIQREEQSHPKLTKLPENFYASVATYVTQKKKLIASKEDKRSSLEIKSIENLIEDIFNRRERKIINTAINSARTGIPPENITDEERAFYDGLLAFIKGRRDNILKNILEESVLEIKEQPAENIAEKIEEKMEESVKETAEILSAVKLISPASIGVIGANLGVSLIVFKEDVPSFVGSDMRPYGPFKKGDIAKVPDENMRVLLERGVVEEFKVSKD